MSDSYSIRPDDIDVSGGETHAFAPPLCKFEPDVLAYWLIRFFQEREGWYSFTEADLNRSMNEQAASEGLSPVLGDTLPTGKVSPQNAMMFGELPFLEWFAERGEDGRWRVKKNFIDRCHEASAAA